MAVQPFKVHVPDSTLEDLRERLATTRWPDEINDSGWDYGSNLAYVKELTEYWRTRFDWRAQEEMLNSFDQYRTTIDGLGIHFIHERGKGPNPLPLVITHGWPKNPFEMIKIIPLLTDPASHGGRPGGLLRRGRPIRTGIRVLGPPAAAGDELLADRRHLGKDNDGGVGVPTVRRSRRRLGSKCNGPPRVYLPPVCERHPHNPGWWRTAIHRSGFSRVDRSGESIPSGARAMASGRRRVRSYTGDQTPDSCLRAERLPGRPGGLDRRKMALLERL